MKEEEEESKQQQEMTEWNNRTFKGETRQEKVRGVKGRRKRNAYYPGHWAE